MTRKFLLATLVLVGAALAGLSSATAAPISGGLGAALAGSAAEPVHCRPYPHWHPWGYGTGCAVRRYVPPRRHYCVRRCGPHGCRTVCY
ncbi:MAG TPA: hypothetical protein VHA77_16445 [Xanthobacteraceae bacterium]|nr:hypothetical protein [Xanthobacteraceae bacterium]